MTVQPGLRTAYVPQLETVNWNFPVTVFECVLMARTQGRQWPRASRTDKADVAAVLERLGIAELAERHIRQLSGGQQQRMFLARALLSNPRLLVLDEPTSGVDVSTRHDMLHLLADLHEDGISIVLTTHDLNGMAAHLPHLVTINGKIVAEGTPSEVITPDVLERTFGARLEVLEHLGMPVVIDDYHRVDPASRLVTAVTTACSSWTRSPARCSTRFFQKGLVVATLSGALLGFVGVYITLRGMSYIGHGLSHAIFGGFAAASLVSASFIYLGAGIWGVSSALAINWVTRRHRIGADAAIGVITTASFALGVALLSRYGSSGPSFDNALFGSIYGISC